MESGTRLGPYEILELLGKGGIGEVWLAEDSRLGRKVAIKTLPPDFAVEPERVARFEQEARAAAALNHPNIAVVFDVGEHDAGVRFIVQEYLEVSRCASCCPRAHRSSRAPWRSARRWRRHWLRLTRPASLPSAASCPTTRSLLLRPA